MKKCQRYCKELKRGREEIKYRFIFIRFENAAEYKNLLHQELRFG